MILNPAAIIPVGVALVIYKQQSQAVLDLSGSADHVNSMSHVSKLIYRFDALIKLLDGLLMEELINKCVSQVLLLAIRSSDLECYSGCLRRWAAPRTSSEMCAITPNISVTMLQTAINTLASTSSVRILRLVGL